ncbi:MAG: 50S ribosomal protein L9 [Candidatus Ryanbacteria bacterium]|nr:50S ribosomal protein L9 [Candidatus Ryanbacteria bacterium]
MKVILLKDIPQLGQQGRILTVKDGYGRNFLIPQGLAREADKKAVKMVEDTKITQARRLAEKASALEAEKKALSQVALVFHKPANDQGHLFAAVTADDVMTELKRRHFRTIEKDQLWGLPIKLVGKHDVEIKIKKERLYISVRVEAEKKK